MVCLVESVTKTAIYARRVTTQTHLVFDRRTGVAEVGEERVPCTINSVAPLPVEIHNIFLGLDRKFRLEHDPERLKLTEAEKRAYLYLDSHYPSNLLPPV
jgi:hypothetical protein